MRRAFSSKPAWSLPRYTRMHASCQRRRATRDDRDVIAALSRPEPSSALTAWTAQPIAIAIAVLLVAGYARGLRRTELSVPRGRIVLFVAGVALLIWTSCGFPAVY